MSDGEGMSGSLRDYTHRVMRIFNFEPDPKLAALEESLFHIMQEVYRLGAEDHKKQVQDTIKGALGL